MAGIAGGLALLGLEIRSARTVTEGEAAVSLWEVTRPDVDAAKVRERMRPVLAGEVDLAARLALDPAQDDVPARVAVLPQRSETATLLEVRAQDRRGPGLDRVQRASPGSATRSARPTCRRTAPRPATSSTSSTRDGSRSTTTPPSSCATAVARALTLTCATAG